MFSTSLRVYFTRGALGRDGLVHGVVPLSSLRSVIPRSPSYLCSRQKQRTVSSSAVTRNDGLRLWTVDDYHDLVDAGLLDNHRVELIHGSLVKIAPQSPMHACTTRFVHDTFMKTLGNRAIVLDSKPITLSDSEPEPDITIVAVDPDDYTNRHPAAGDIFTVIEVARSTLLKDSTTKLQLYARECIPEYWIVNLVHRNVRVLRNPEGKGYKYDKVFSSGCITPASFPDCPISVETFFR